MLLLIIQATRLLLVALLSIPMAWADTLFIDLNNAPTEIAVFDAYEKTVVLPSFGRIPLARREALAQLMQETQAHSLRAETCIASDCDNIYAQLRHNELTRLALTRDYSAKDLATEMDALLASRGGRGFDQIVLSGHHERGFFDGELMALSNQDLIALFKNRPALMQATQHATLLGCVTGTQESYRHIFKDIFPHAQLIVGAENNAPIKTDARNLSFIRLLQGNRFIDGGVKNPQALQKLHQLLRTTGWPVSMVWQGDTWINQEGQINPLVEKNIQ